jgi:hypothetical protein
LFGESGVIGNRSLVRSYQGMALQVVVLNPLLAHQDDRYPDDRAAIGPADEICPSRRASGAT